VLAKTDSERDLQIFPDVSLVSIGGQSIFDRGKDAILPKKDHCNHFKMNGSLIEPECLILSACKKIINQLNQII
jgi:hypothetical protein